MLVAVEQPAAAPDAGGRRAAPGLGHGLRPGRLDAAQPAPGPRAAARRHPRLPAQRRGRDRAPRRPRGPLAGRRRDGLLRLPARRGGRRGARGPLRLGDPARSRRGARARRRRTTASRSRRASACTAARWSSATTARPAGRPFGETPNVAARVEGVSGPDDVTVTAAIRQFVAGHFDLEPLGPHELKGVEEPIELFRVSAPRRNVARFEAERAARLVPLVDRAPERAVLSARRRPRPRRSSAPRSLLTGEPGIGKSRLIHHLVHRFAADLEPLHLQCRQYGGASPLHPLVDALRERWALSGDDGERRRGGRAGAGRPREPRAAAHRAVRRPARPADARAARPRRSARSAGAR